MSTRKRSLFPAFAIPLLAILFFPFNPPQSVAADVYSYTDENGVPVITNTPLPEKIKAKAKKIDSYKNITDEDRKAWEKEKADRMKAWRDSQVTEEERKKMRTESEEKVRLEAEKPENLKRLESEAAEAAKVAKETKERAVEVLKVIP